MSAIEIKITSTDYKKQNFCWFEVYGSVTNWGAVDQDWVDNAEWSDVAFATRVIHAQLTAGTTYYHKVRAVYDNGTTITALGTLVTTVAPADAIPGAVVYKGTWNAATNTPTIPAAGPGNNGWYYRVSVAGSTSEGGITDWKVGDWLISDGTAWQKVDNTDQVTSVAGRQGAVVLAAADISDASANAISLIQAASYAAMRTLLGLVIGTTVQAYNATLASLSALGTAADKFAYTTGINTWAEGSITSVARTLLAQTTQALMRTTGLGMSADGSALVSAASYAAMRTALGAGAASGLATLDSGGLVPVAQLPPIAITDTFPVASQSAMLALTAEKGDIAIRSDLNKCFVLSTNSPSTLADWLELKTPTDAVLSVAGLTGAITASALKVALAIAAGDVSGLAAVATSGSATDLGTGTLPAGRLPLPAAAALGGVKSLVAVAKKYLTSIDAATGLPVAAQPISTDLSDFLAKTSWTPTDNSGAGLTLTNAGSSVEKRGDIVTITAFFVYPASMTGPQGAMAASVGGIPYTVSGYTGVALFDGSGANVQCYLPGGGTVFNISDRTSGLSVLNSTLAGKFFILQATFFV